MEQIAIIEEPFREHLEIDVSDIPLRLAADESAHTDEDALKRIQMGYTAIALKAVAKTLRIKIKIANKMYFLTITFVFLLIHLIINFLFLFNPLFQLQTIL